MCCNVQRAELLGPSTQTGVSPCLEQHITDAGTVFLRRQVERREPHRLGMGEWENDMWNESMGEWENDRMKT